MPQKNKQTRCTQTQTHNRQQITRSPPHPTLLASRQTSFPGACLRARKRAHIHHIYVIYSYILSAQSEPPFCSTVPNQLSAPTPLSIAQFTRPRRLSKDTYRYIGAAKAMGPTRAAAALQMLSLPQCTVDHAILMCRGST